MNGEGNGSEAAVPDDWAPAFFEAYATKAAYGSPSKAAKAAGVHIRTFDKRMREDADFRAMIADADRQLDEALEHVALDHAINGTHRPVYQHGEVVGTVNEFDHRLLQFLLERRIPERYHLPTRIEQVNPDTPGAFTFRLGDKPLALEPGDE